MGVIDKIRTSCAKSGNVDLGCDPGSFGDLYPGIFEIIATQRFKGKERKMGRLSISVNCGKAVVCLNSKEAGKCAFYKADSIGEALEGLERHLQAGDADWRDDKWA